MQYALLVAEPPREVAKRQDPAAAPAYWGAWASYMGALGQAGIMRGGQGLEPAMLATTLRLRDGQRHVQDGPYADSKEQLGGFVPLLEQSPFAWSRRLLAEAEALLREASRAATLGRFQIEAAIQSVHVEMRLTGADRSGALLGLYDVPARLSPMAGVLVARAAALAEAGQAHAALRELDGMAEALVGYQPWWATRAHVLDRLGDGDAAREARRRAAGVTEDPAVRAWLLAR
ncbi:hypothetical protein KTR66_12670 [Roseococcus sp. SDR]|uniref:YciI family protein n=1 Tax=Roseococcus sp. SDR TaxID=2835532 RepID=UPI001BCECAE5|nr:YciI family protein [Roseococcus sp. SDR]MBS7790857.1 hypothetical protein [Roseococcus sp. SDR]MBV1846171.1 hypothetical protein [Roseococcus sp. SDR]